MLLNRKQNITIIRKYYFKNIYEKDHVGQEFMLLPIMPQKIIPTDLLTLTHYALKIDLNAIGENFFFLFHRETLKNSRGEFFTHLALHEKLILLQTIITDQDRLVITL